MTPAQLIKEIRQLSPEEQKVLLDEFVQIVQDETEPAVPRKSASDRLHGIAKPEFGTRDEIQNSQKERLTLSQRLYGILKFDGNPPNDEEVKDMIADYLIRKYS
jgi:hypothetical protein